MQHFNHNTTLTDVDTMPPLPAVDKSPHREEIIERLLRGESARSISKWLKDNFNESIDHSNISRYKSNHLDVVGKAKKKIEKRKKKEITKKKLDKAVDKEVAINDKVDDAVDKVVTGIDFLDNVIQTANKVNLESDPSYDFEKETPLKKEAHKLNMINTGIKAADVKSKIMRDEPEPPTVNIFVDKIAKNKDDLDKSKDFLDSIYGCD